MTFGQTNPYSLEKKSINRWRNFANKFRILLWIIVLQVAWALRQFHIGKKMFCFFLVKLIFFSKNIVKKKQILIFFRIRLYTLAFHDIRPFLWKKNVKFFARLKVTSGRHILFFTEYERKCRFGWLFLMISS